MAVEGHEGSIEEFRPPPLAGGLPQRLEHLLEMVDM